MSEQKNDNRSPFNQKFFDDLGKNNEQNLAYEISMLRAEIQELRNELMPISSLIITGKQVIEEFKSLKKD